MFTRNRIAPSLLPSFFENIFEIGNWKLECANGTGGRGTRDEVKVVSQSLLVASLSKVVSQPVSRCWLVARAQIHPLLMFMLMLSVQRLSLSSSAVSQFNMPNRCDIRAMRFNPRPSCRSFFLSLSLSLSLTLSLFSLLLGFRLSIRHIFFLFFGLAIYEQYNYCCIFHVVLTFAFHSSPNKSVEAQLCGGSLLPFN